MYDRENGRDRELCRVAVSPGPMFPISLSYVCQMTHMMCMRCRARFLGELCTAVFHGQGVEDTIPSDATALNSPGY